MYGNAVRIASFFLFVENKKNNATAFGGSFFILSLCWGIIRCRVSSPQLKIQKPDYRFHSKES
jgi:hypothetical protein